ncbi:MAG: TonB-dependent receptor [Rhodospirillaceae bacterium]
MTLKRFLAATCALTALGAGSANAQQIALEEIVVTARKTEERLQDVPLSITAFTADELTERGLDDVFEISQFTTNFGFEKLNRYGVQGGGSRPVIRGQSNILGEGNASVFVDGIQYNDSILSFPFDIVERVEVIKGPQAALFGRSTFAGAISITTKKGSNEFENKVSVRAAEHDDYEVNLMSRGPIVEDKVFYMVHGRYYDYGGEYRNSLDNQKVGQEESLNFNAALEFRASENFTATLAGGYGKDDDGAAAIVLQDRTFNNCFLDVARQYYCGEVNEFTTTEQNLDLFGDDIGLDKDSYRLSAKLEYDGGDFAITSNTGYFKSDQKYGYDVDLTSNSTALGGTFNRIAFSDREEWSTEVLVQSTWDSPLNYLFGTYYYNSDRSFREDRLAGFTVDDGVDKVRNWAGFGLLSYDLTESLTAAVELRYSSDKVSNENPTRAGLPLLEETFKSWTPRFTVDWQVNDDSLIYASLAKGNKPGAFNANPLIDPVLIPVEEEKSWNYELGTKNTLLDGRMTLNAAIFYIDWTNQQLTSQTTLSSGAPASYISNAGETKVEGIEIEMTNAFTDNFTGGFGYGLNDATFVVNDDLEQAAFFGDPSVAGNQTPNNSKHQLNVFGRYEYPVADGINAFFRADFSYAERKYAQVYNLAHTGDQKLLNLKVGLDADNWQVTLFVDNVTDDLTPSTVIRFVDFKNFLPVGTSARTSSFVRAFQYPLADGRQFGLTASYSF